MNIANLERRRRKAISPVLATVILIAITLIAAIAIAGFVFGLFGTFTSSATLTIDASSVVCVNTVPGTGPWHCGMNVHNTGSGASAITGAGPTGFSLGTTSGTPAVYSAAATSITIPANSVTSVGVLIAAAGHTTGQTVSGFLVVSSGANLAFTVVLN